MVKEAPVNHTQITPETGIYENEKHDLSISDKLLMIGENTYPLRSISAASLRTKPFPIWPGILFLLWAAVWRWG